MRRVLLLDDEINVLHALHRALKTAFPAGQLTVEIFTDPEQALLRSGEVRFDAVISDYRMPGINGIDFLKTIRKIQPDAVRLVLSASTEFETVIEAVNQAEVFRYIPKPWQAPELLATLKLAFERHDEALRLRAERGELTPQELEAMRLEAEEPGITKVNWTEDGAVRLD